MKSDYEVTLFMPRRLRRNRRKEAVRRLVSETVIQPSDFVAPLFFLEEGSEKQEVSSMPGVYRYPLGDLLREAERLYNAGVRAVDLFVVVPESKKDADGSYAWNAENGLCEAIEALKRALPDLWVMVDIALDPFTVHGHDGILGADGSVMNDTTVEALGWMTLACVNAGADMIAPSDMMDGRVGYLRMLLDEHGYDQVGILSYTAKYASAFYGPFRDALHSAPKVGDKKGYQMDPANAREALVEAELDIDEGADMLLVKPALPYLDVICRLKERYDIPIGGYHVSGEYAMIKAAAERGWLDGERTMYESLLGIKRAGADFIFSYAALEVLDYQKRVLG